MPPPPDNAPNDAPKQGRVLSLRGFVVGAFISLIVLIAADPEHGLFKLVIGPAFYASSWPDAALIPAAVFLIAAVLSALRLNKLNRPTWHPFVLGAAALAWYLDRQYEIAVQAQHANIRIDLFLVGPIMWAVTVAGVVAAAKAVGPVRTTPIVTAAVLGIALTLRVISVFERQPPEYFGPSLVFKNPSKFGLAELSFDVDRGAYRGPCPVTLTFSGAIRTSGARGFLDYALRRSDGTVDSAHTLHFAAGESKPVSTTWTVGTPGQRFVGWEQLAVDAPYYAELRAPFVLDCQSGSTPAAQPVPMSGSFHIVQVSLDADRERYAGRCPVSVTLTGTVRARGFGDVSYTFEDLDAGLRTEWRGLHFDSAGSRSVGTTWSAGKPGRTSLGLFTLKVNQSPPDSPSPDAPSVHLIKAFTSTCDSLPTAPAAAPPAAAPLPTRPAPASSARKSPAFHVVELKQEYGPSDYSGACPVFIRFSADVKTAGDTGTVDVELRRSDGAATLIGSKAPDSSGSTTWGTYWDFGRPGVTDSGWVAFYVAHPGPLTSKRMKFRVKCNTQVVRAPVVPWPPDSVFVSQTILGPKSYKGRCPVTIKLTAFLTATTPGTMKFRSVNSDGQRGPVEAVQIMNSETKVVRETWTLGSSGFKHDGWLAIEMLSPANGELSRSAFNIVCDP